MKCFSALAAFLLFSSTLLIGAPSYAAGSGSDGWSIGFNLGIAAVDQTDMDLLQQRSNTRAGGVSAGQLGNAWEMNGFIGYRFSGSMMAFQLRPSYLFQSEDGKDGAGLDYKYEVDGFTVFPMFRFYLLEDSTIRFFTQLGIGFGFMNGSITEAGRTVDFSGVDMGYSAGMGSEFCLFGGDHCFTIEGNFRFLRIERLTADAVSGDPAGLTTPSGLSQATVGREVEMDGKDFGLTLTGIQGFVGYTMYF